MGFLEKWGIGKVFYLLDFSSLVLI